MAYRIIAVTVFLFASTASAAQLSVVVQGADDRADEIAAALRSRLVAGGHELVDAAASTAALDDGALTQMRQKLDVARVVVATVQRQGKDGFLITVRAADADGIARRYGEATAITLVDRVVSIAADLPPLPATPTPTPPATTTPPPAPAVAQLTTPTGDASTEPPAAAAVVPPEPPMPISSSSSSEPPPRRRKHEYGLLIGGLVAFFVPWLATVGFAAHYVDYNPNAARLGFIPVAGPFLGRRKISDKDLSDGYDVGLTVDGAIQIVGTSVLVAGILYAAIGVPARGDRAGAPRWRPLFAVGPGGAQLGAAVSW